MLFTTVRHYGIVNSEITEFSNIENIKKYKKIRKFKFENCITLIFKKYHANLEIP